MHAVTLPVDPANNPHFQKQVMQYIQSGEQLMMLHVGDTSRKWAEATAERYNRGRPTFLYVKQLVHSAKDTDNDSENSIN